MKNFELNNPVKIVFGKGTLKNVGEEGAKLGKKAIIVTGKSSMKKSGILDKVAQSLKKAGVESVIYSYVTPNPKVNEVNEATELAREDGCDFVIGLGGGSAMDAAKGVAIVAKCGGCLWDYVALPDKKAEQIPDALPIMLIPTLAATGSEGNPAAVFTNTETNQKAAIYNPMRIFPKVSIVDSDTTLSVPKKQTAEGVIDIIMHVLEEYLTGDSGCGLQDRLTEGIIMTCFENGQRLMKDLNDREARENISLASTVALQGIPNSGRAGIWAVHPMEHAITGMFDSIAHGSGIAALLPPYLTYLGRVKPEKVIQLSKRVFEPHDDISDEARIDICIKGFREFIRDIGLKLSLKEQGVKEEDIPKLAEKTLEVSGMPFPGMTKDDLVLIFKQAYEG